MKKLPGASRSIINTTLIESDQPVPGLLDYARWLRATRDGVACILAFNATY